MTVAALYVLARGPYANMPGVDPWPERRNALLYPGPWPVVAHPPCAWWSVRRQAKLSSGQGPHLAATAVTQVQEWGGVCEQPERSLLWDTMGLPRPEPYRQATIGGPQRDEHGGFTVEVDLSSWHDPERLDQEHGEHKRTWLYIVGVDYCLATDLPLDAPSPRKSSVLRRDKRPGSKSTWLRSRDDMMGPEARKRSPKAFAEWLVALAETVKVCAESGQPPPARRRVGQLW